MARGTVLRTAVLGLLFSAASLYGAESGRFGVSVVVDGTPAAEYPFGGRTYIEALKGRTFTLRLSNPTGERVAVALSVDGLNVVDAKHTTALDATKWVLGPYATIEIPGWQVNGETSRRFFFTETGRSYAKWIGDTRNVGTIEAVFFREKWRPPEFRPLLSPEAPLHEAQREASAGRASPKDGANAKGKVQASPEESDRFAATGIGERTRFPVTWIDFDEDPVPAARVALRYEFRRELLRLGVLQQEDQLYARDRARGFEHRYAPEPDRRH